MFQEGAVVRPLDRKGALSSMSAPPNNPLLPSTANRLKQHRQNHVFLAFILIETTDIPPKTSLAQHQPLRVIHSQFHNASSIRSIKPAQASSRRHSQTPCAQANTLSLEEPHPHRSPIILQEKSIDHHTEESHPVLSSPDFSHF